MRLNSFLAIGLACTATARFVDRRRMVPDMIPEVASPDAAVSLKLRAAAAPMDAAQLTKLLNDVAANFKKIAQATSAITKDNVASQMNAVIAAAKGMNSALESNAKTMKASPKPIGNILTLVGVLSPAINALKGANSTLVAVLQTRQIVLDAKLEGKVREAFSSNTPGLGALINALPSQLPDSAKQSLQTALGSSASLGPEVTGPILEAVVDTIMDLFTGKTPAPDFAALAKGLGKGDPTGGKGPGTAEGGAAAALTEAASTAAALTEAASTAAAPAPKDGKGAAPKDGKGAAPKDGKGAAPKDGKGSTPKGGKGTAEESAMATIAEAASAIGAPAPTPVEPTAAPAADSPAESEATPASDAAPKGKGAGGKGAAPPGGGKGKGGGAPKSGGAPKGKGKGKGTFVDISLFDDEQ